MKILITFVLLFLTTGCVNEYKNNYKYANGATPETINFIRANPAPILPSIEQAPNTDGNTLLATYAKRGYLMIGSSFFNSTRSATDNAATEQGKEVGADLVVIFNPQYTGSTTSQVPFTTPTTTTSYTNDSATAYGSGGVVNAYGTSTTTTYGSETTYIPITVNHINYGALYFVKIRHPFGALTRELTDSERKLFQTNKGAVVQLVIDNSPAFYGDILVDDVIVDINGTPIININTYNNTAFNNANKLAKVKILRNGKLIEKEIQFGK